MAPTKPTMGSALALAPSQLAVAVCDVGSIKVFRWDAPDQPPTEHVIGKNLSGPSLAFSPDGKLLACGSHDWDTSGGGKASGDPIPSPLKVSLFEWENETIEMEFDGPIGSIGHTSLSFSPDGGRLAICTGFGFNVGRPNTKKSLEIRDMKTGQLTASLPEANTGWWRPSVAFLPDCQTVVVAGDPLLIWDVSTKTRREPTASTEDSIRCVAAGRKGNLFVTGGRYVTIWDATTRKPLRTIWGSPSSIPPVGATGNLAEIKPLTDEQLRRLLDTRLNETMSQMMAQSANQPFGQFANMFLAFSTMTVGRGVGLMTPDHEVSKRTVQSPYPLSYRPRLREVLDSLALQTFSKWSYDPSSKYLHSEVEHGGPVDNLAMFEFVPAERELPYALALAAGWKANDKGNWVMYVPPAFIVGMDIHNMGQYSSDGDNQSDFFRGVAEEVSLEWARRIGQKISAADLTAAKVGKYDAQFFDVTLPTRDGKQLRWRQWVYMVDDVCYAVISTIFPSHEATIFPDIEKMLPTFRMKAKRT